MSKSYLEQSQAVSEQVPRIANSFVSEIVNMAEALRASGEINEDVYYSIINDVMKWENATEKLLNLYNEYGV